MQHLHSPMKSDAASDISLEDKSHSRGIRISIQQRSRKKKVRKKSKRRPRIPHHKSDEKKPFKKSMSNSPRTKNLPKSKSAPSRTWADRIDSGESNTTWVDECEVQNGNPLDYVHGNRDAASVEESLSRLEDAWELLKEAKQYTCEERHEESNGAREASEASKVQTRNRRISQIIELKNVGENLSSYVGESELGPPETSYQQQSEDDAISLSTNDLLTSTTSVTQRSTMTARTGTLTLLSDISSPTYSSLPSQSPLDGEPRHRMAHRQESRLRSPQHSHVPLRLSPLGMYAQGRTFSPLPSPHGNPVHSKTHAPYNSDTVSQLSSLSESAAPSEISTLSTMSKRSRRGKSKKRSKSTKRYSSRGSTAARRRRKSQSAKSTTSHSSTSKIILPTKTIIKLYKKHKVRFLDEHSTELKRLTYNGAQVNVTPEQVSLLLSQRQKEQQLERAQRMRDAKERASQLNKFSAKYRTYMKKKIPKDEGVLFYVNQSIRAMVRGWVVRWRLKRLREATIKIQVWYRDVLPQQRAFQKYYRDMVENRRRSRLVTFTQNQLRGYAIMVSTHRHLLLSRVHPVQCAIRGSFVQNNHRAELAQIIKAQASIRRFLVLQVYEIALLDEKLTFIKMAVLRKYEKLFAPYSRRALFCYRTRFNNKKSYSIALREYKYIEARTELFMERKTYHHHLQFIVSKMLKNKNNPNFTKIVRNVFEDDIHGEKNSSVGMLRSLVGRVKGLRKKRSYSYKHGENKAPVLVTRGSGKNSLNSLKKLKRSTTRKEMDIDILLVRMAPNMFSESHGLQRANWAGLIIYSFVIHDLITPKTRFDKNDINLRFMLDRKSTHKIPYNKI